MNWLNTWPMNEGDALVGRLQQLEHAAVLQILKDAGLRAVEQDILAKSPLLPKRLSFNALVDVTGFPLRLCTADLSIKSLNGLEKEMTLRPTKTKLFAAFTDALKECTDAEGTLGVVLRGVGLGSRIYVFNDFHVSQLGSRGHYWRISSKLFFLEPLSALVERCGSADTW